MTRGKLHSLSLGLLALTAPWWFDARPATLLWGVPAWALYSLGVTLAYASCIGWWLERYWNVSIRDERDES